MALGSASVSTAQFRPFSYQEMLAPLSAYTQEYNNIQEGLSDLGTVANSYKDYIPETSNAGKQLASYNSALKNVADDIAQNGLNAASGNRDMVYKLKNDYNNNILGINKAAQNLEQLYKLTQQKRASDDSLLVGSMPTIDEMVADPSAVPTAISGNELYTHGVKAASAASLRKFSTSTMGKELAGQYFDIKNTTGYNSKETANFIKNLDSIPELKAAFDNINNMYNIGKLSSADQLRAKEFTLEGILGGMGYKEEHQYPSDKQWDLDAEEQKENLQFKHTMQEEYFKGREQGYIAPDGSFVMDNAANNNAGGDTFSSPESTMRDSGDFQNMYNVIKGLTVQGGRPRADIFGNRGNVNPMKVYEELQKMSVPVSAHGVANVVTGGTNKNILNDIKRKYGVSSIISANQYMVLKNLGYNSSTNFLKEGFKHSRYATGITRDMLKRLNNKDTETTNYFFNNKDAVKDISEQVLNNIQRADEQGAIKGRVYRADDNGRPTDKVASASDFDEKKNPITKVGYNGAYKKLVIQTKDGKQYYADGTIGDEVIKGVINSSDSYKKALINNVHNMVHRNLTLNEMNEVTKKVNDHVLNGIMEHWYRGFDQMAKTTSSKDD